MRLGQGGRRKREEEFEDDREVRETGEEPVFLRSLPSSLPPSLSMDKCSPRPLSLSLEGMGGRGGREEEGAYKKN